MNKYLQLLKLKGIWIPFMVAILYLLLIISVQAENYFTIGFAIKTLPNQYQASFFFLALPIYFLNKINFSYINTRSYKSLVIERHKLIVVLSIIFTLLIAIISISIFSLYDIPQGEVHLYELAWNSFLYSIFCGVLFNFLLNLSNSVGFLFLIYFLPVFQIFLRILDRQFETEIMAFSPFQSELASINLTFFIFLTLIFLGFSIIKSKRYHF